MKKALIIILILVVGSSGFLFYDWYDKTRRKNLEPAVPLYSWTDTKGVRHYSDTEPPPEARNVEKTKGYEYISPPLVVTIRDKTLETFKRAKAKLSKSKSKKKSK